MDQLGYDTAFLRIVGAPDLRSTFDGIPADAAVVARFGVPPSRLPSYAALIGDASDNLPGVPGIGPSTARRLLTEGVRWQGRGDIWHSPEQVGFVLPSESGGLIAGLQSGLHRFDSESGAFDPPMSVRTQPGETA